MCGSCNQSGAGSSAELADLFPAPSTQEAPPIAEPAVEVTAKVGAFEVIVVLVALIGAWALLRHLGAS